MPASKRKYENTAKEGESSRKKSTSKKAVVKQDVGEPSSTKESAEEATRDVTDDTKVFKLKGGWTIKEQEYLFDLIKTEIIILRRTLKMSDFGLIYEAMKEKFEGKNVEKGEPMVGRFNKKGVFVPAVAACSFPHAIRDANALHSYAMHKNHPNRAYYDRLFDELKARNFEETDDEAEEDDGEEGHDYEE